MLKRLKLVKERTGYVSPGLYIVLGMKIAVRENAEISVVVKRIVEIVIFQIILKTVMICIFAKCVLYLNLNYHG